MSDNLDLLEFGSVEVYYIIWNKSGNKFYLRDMTPDLQHLEWTKNIRQGFYFYTEQEASKHSKFISKTRPGTMVEPGEIDILDEINLLHD